MTVDLDHNVCFLSPRRRRRRRRRRYRQLSRQPLVGQHNNYDASFIFFSLGWEFIDFCFASFTFRPPGSATSGRILQTRTQWCACEVSRAPNSGSQRTLDESRQPSVQLRLGSRRVGGVSLVSGQQPATNKTNSQLSLRLTSERNRGGEAESKSRRQFAKSNRPAEQH